MNFTIETQEFKKRVELAASVASSKSIQDASDCIFFQIQLDHTLTMNMSSTNNKLFIKQTDIPILSLSTDEDENEVNQFLVNASLLSKDVNYIQSESITITVDKTKPYITIQEAGSSSISKFMTRDLATLPVYPDFESADYTQMNVTDLKESVQVLSNFVALNSPDKALEGIHFIEQRAISANLFYGMILRDIQVSEVQGITFNADVTSLLKYLKDTEQIGVYLNEEFHKMLFCQDTTYYAIALINREYPYKYLSEMINKKIQQINATMVVSKEEIQNVVRRLTNFTDAKDNNLLKMNYDGNIVRCEKQRMIGGDSAVVELSTLAIEAKPFNILINIRGLEALLKSTIESELNFKMHFEKQKSLIFCQTLIPNEIQALAFLSLTESQ